MVRDFVSAAVLAFALTADAQSLRDLADQRGIRIGAAADPSRFNEIAYAGTLSREFNQIEPENAMKFDATQPGINTYTFAQADSIVAFGRKYNMAVRGHTLVWHSQVPTWVTNGGYTPAQLSNILHDHINTVVGHYAGQVYAWDVVNEAFNDNGTLRETIWSGTPGYIEQALRWARAADPAALLFVNDFSAEGINAKSDAIYKMAQDFVTRGVPLHGIGLQMHFTTGNTNLTGVDSNIQRLTAMGLQVHITELDVRLPVDSTGTATPAQLATQAQIYRDVTAICLKYPLCTSIQTWGFTDRYSWIPGTFAGFGAGLPFDAAYQPKPAYTAMQSSLATAPPVIAAAGIVNAASYAGGAVAPGEIVVFFGPTFGPAAFTVAQGDSSGNFPTELAGVRLLVDGVPAPLIYARTGQISAVVPFSTAGPATRVEYEYLGILSNAVSLPLVAAVPGIFTLDSSGTGTSAILDVAYKPVTEANAVRRGDAIQIFATGGGLNASEGTVIVKIGGVSCPVFYAGGAPGLIAGALQVNATIAAGVPTGEQPIVVSVGAAASQPGATVWIR
jgi:endo-1,4-beta-xylanase